MKTDPIGALDQQQLEAISAIMSADARTCLNALVPTFNDDPPDQFWSRMFVRSFMAWVEAYVHDMKATVLRLHECGFAPLSVPEAGALSDCIYELNDKGQPTARPRFVQTERGMRAVFRFYANIFELSHEISGTSEDWHKFRRTVSLRNRILHPRTAADLLVSKQELHHAGDTMAWFLNEHTRLIRATIEQFRSGRMLQRAKDWVARQGGA